MLERALRIVAGGAEERPSSDTSKWERIKEIGGRGWGKDMLKCSDDKSYLVPHLLVQAKRPMQALLACMSEAQDLS